ncbi:hypothetical protein Cst04h_19410 [Corynebacterium striatum]|uniref:Uncharacterized protein n=1 Tax=Corynebacterium striatum TaxID=43770 RepID=A0ABC9ZP63_CORST|nr:hypothetical protein Cst04h_19410 [Corynebacterium striatum]
MPFSLVAKPHDSVIPKTHKVRIEPRGGTKTKTSAALGPQEEDLALRKIRWRQAS